MLINNVNVSAPNGRFNYLKLIKVIDAKFQMDTRRLKNSKLANKYNITFRYPADDDMWLYFMEAAFRVRFRNDQNNSLYIGTTDGINYKKLKVQPNEIQKEILEEWNKTFGHLTDKHGWLKVKVSW